MEINFVFQVRSFHRFKRENGLSANAQALWMELFGLFNERRFPAEMPVSTTHLCMILNLSKDTVLRARKELEANELIESHRGKTGRSATVIRMNYFSKGESCGQDCGKTVDNLCDQEEEDEELLPPDLCDATEDANSAANSGKKIASIYATKEKTCDAHLDANCDTYTNPNVPLNGVYEEDEYTAATRRGAANSAEKEMDAAMMEFYGRKATKGEKHVLLPLSFDASCCRDLSGLFYTAIKAASEHGSQSPAQYASSVLEDWQSKGLISGEEAETYMMLAKSVRGTDGAERERREREVDDYIAARTARRWREVAEEIKKSRRNTR